MVWPGLVGPDLAGAMRTVWAVCDTIDETVGIFLPFSKRPRFRLFQGIGSRGRFLFVYAPLDCG